MKRFIWIVLAGFLLTGCGSGDAAEPSAEGNIIEATDVPADTSKSEKYYLTFSATDVDGQTVSSEILGNSKLTMLNIWATYCNPCLEEMPYLGEIAAEADPSEFQIVGILSDVSEQSSQEDIDYAKELIAKTGADYTHLLLGQDLYSTLVGGVSAVPTTFFVKQDGEVLGYVTGAADKATWEELINELLAEVEK